METTPTPSDRKPKGKGPWKGLGLGALGLGLACVGCCLAPLAGVFLATSVGAGIAGVFSSRPVLAGILGGTLALLAYLVWKSRRAACCSTPGAGCGENACGVRNPEADATGGRV